MFTRFGDGVVGISTFGGANSSTTTLVFQGQQDIAAVLANIGAEIRLYNDEELTQLAAIFNQVEVERASVDYKGENVSVTISASRLTELETEQLKTDVATQKALQTENDDALIELAGMIEEQADAIAELGETVQEALDGIEAIKMELAALKPQQEETEPTTEEE